MSLENCDDGRGGGTAKKWIVIGLILVTAIVIVIILLATSTGNSTTHADTDIHIHYRDWTKYDIPKRDIGREIDVCTTENCRVTRAIKNAMDSKANPCEDFFRFSCGNWMKSNPVPVWHNTWSRFDILHKQIVKNIKVVLQSKITETDAKPLVQAKKFYNRCLHQRSDILDKTKLRDVIDKVLRIGDAKSDLGRKLGELYRRLYVLPLITELDIEPEDFNNTKYTLKIVQPNFGLDRNDLLNSAMKRHFYKHEIVGTLSYYYDKLSTLQQNAIANDIIDFEVKLAQVCDPADDTKKTNLTLKKFLDLTNKTSSMMNWSTYFEEILKVVLNQHEMDPERLQNFTVVLCDANYFDELEKVLKTTGSEIIVYYITYRLIPLFKQELIPLLGHVFSMLSKNKVELYTFRPPRSDVCLQFTNKIFGMAISYRYIPDYFKTDSQSQMTEMIFNIKKVFLEKIDKVDWIVNNSTRSEVKQKVNKIQDFIGYPDWLKNKTALESYYSDLSLNFDGNHFDDVLKIIEWKMGTVLGINNKKDKWIIIPTDVNAFYSPFRNSISFPAGILEPPFFFSGKLIQALNYGAIGMVIGHEIMHGFDNIGITRDGDGNLRNWWDEKSLENFNNRAKCFANQYSKYGEGYMKLNGNQTLGENIADNSGIALAFSAYKSFVQKHGPEQKLSGLDYTPEQLFFIASAQIWCKSYTIFGMNVQIERGVHSPSKFRVAGYTKNSPDFQTVWNCQNNNAISKCQLW